VRPHHRQQTVRTDDHPIIVAQDEIDRFRRIEFVFLDLVRLAQRLRAHALHKDAMAQAKHLLERIPIEERVVPSGDGEHALLPERSLGMIVFARAIASPPFTGVGLGRCLREGC
jgi:hypothetical protein